MTRGFLLVLPKLCYLMAVLLFLAKSYFVVEFLTLGYFPELDMTRDIAPQLLKTFAQILAGSFVWVIFGLIVDRQNRMEDRIASGLASLGGERENA